MVLVGVSALALAFAAVAVWYKFTHRDDLAATDTASRYEELNFSIEPPPSPWARDEDKRAALKSPYFLVYKRDNPEAYIAFGARDYDTRSPRESELSQGLMQALEKVVIKSEITYIDEKLEPTWMGEAVKGFRFRAPDKAGVVIEGEGYRLSSKGVGYWCLCWSGETVFEEMQPSFGEARRHCKLLEKRKEWRAKQSSTTAFKGDRTGYTILDGEGVWEEEKDEAQLKYEGADKILKLKKSKKADDIADGQVQVYVVKPTGEPMTVAREFVTHKRQEELKQAGGYAVAFSEVTGPPEGGALPDTVEARSPVVRLQSKVKGASQQDRFHVISAAKVDDQIVIVHAFCGLSREKREAFEPRFLQLAASLHGG